MLKTPEKSKYRPTLEDFWSINPSGAVRNRACRVPNLQELSFQSLPKISEDRSNRPFFHHSQYHCTKKGGPASVFKAPELVHGAFQSNPV